MILAVAMAVFLCLAAFRIDRSSLWLDEAMTAEVMTGTLGEKVGFFLSLPEQHPLYYVVLDPWVRLFGTSEAALRGLSVLFGLAFLWALHRFALRLFGPRVAALAALTCALSPFWLYYSQEARMYTMMGFLAVVTADAYERWLTEPAPKRLLALVLLGIAAVYTHLFFVFFVFVLAGHAVVFRSKETSWARVSAPFLIMGLAYVPWGLLIVTHMPGSHDWTGLSHIVLGLPYTLVRFSIGYSELIANLDWKARIVSLLAESALLLTVAMGVFAPAVLRGFGELRRRGASGWLVLALLVGPAVVTLALSPIRIMVSERYLIVTFPFFLATVAAGVASFGQRGRTAWGAAFLLLSLWILPGYYSKPDFGKEQWREVSRLLEDEARPGDWVAVGQRFALPSLTYYFPEQDGELRVVAADDVGQGEAGDRVWLILSHSTPDEAAALMEQFERGRSIVGNWDFPLETGIRVFLYDARNSALPSGPTSMNPSIPGTLRSGLGGVEAEG